jgi:hypothetical protein
VREEEIAASIRAYQRVLTIETAGKRWLSFNVREHRLQGRSVGTMVQVLTAGGSRRISAFVTELLPLGQFAFGRPSALSAITIAIHCECVLKRQSLLGSNQE